MKFEVDGEWYRIRFQHVHLDGVITVDRTHGRVGRIAHATSCFIDHAQGVNENGRVHWKNIVVAVSRCSEMDSYRKETGRVLSLRRAILSWTDKPAVRAVAFGAYFNRKAIAA